MDYSDQMRVDCIRTIAEATIAVFLHVNKLLASSQYALMSNPLPFKWFGVPASASVSTIAFFEAASKQ